MSGKRIMIVEDEAITALSLKMRLNGIGFDVCHVTGRASEAIELARADPPDAILMDIRLEDEMDGIEAARIINQGIPVIFHSAYADEDTLGRAQRIAPSTFLEKPATDAMLLKSFEAMF